MWYIAFTIGLFGSLHCIGMCGPLAVAFGTREGNTSGQNLLTSLYYNLGRTVTYSLFGLIFGLLGSFILMVDLQKTLSILLGILLIITFLFSIDLDKSISQHSIMGKVYGKVRNFISSVMVRSQEYHPFQLGMANGLLPCGLVYLALAGALASGSLLGGMLFMFLFGLGTIPMLFLVASGYSMINLKLKKRFRTILPYVTLCFGLFLVYRGVVVDMPSELNFWEALKNPVMCH